jgi:hypothetical protein
MNLEDKEYMRALGAIMAMQGYIINGDYAPTIIPVQSVRMIDALMEELEVKEEGIAKARRKKVG